ncbi:MAG: hypothetical protein KGJ62_10205 [Armatimonadetes bacterium]|nr:hypothetical protein [Armatimonadota bacterium]MDE2207414.1 hypothetical protein [Armatimonadota bacterium]
MTALDTCFLKALSEAPSVGTACAPVMRLLRTFFGEGWEAEFVSDGFCLFHCGAPEAIHTLYVSHVDEVGGCVYGPAGGEDGGGWTTRHWGNTAQVFADARLQAMDYLAESGDAAFDVSARAVTTPSSGDVDLGQKLVLDGEAIRPYRTVFTFRQDAEIDGDLLSGKALDPRVTAYAAAEAARTHSVPGVAALFVMAEECAMEVARKAVVWLQRRAPNLRLIVNADVPSIGALGEGRLDTPAIRIFEGRNFIDPTVGIRMAERLERLGLTLHLTSSRSGSQTVLFTPLAHTLSIALPSDGVHLPVVRMSLTGISRLVELLGAIPDEADTANWEPDGLG